MVFRSRSCESVRGSTDSPPLQTAALENEVLLVRVGRSGIVECPLQLKRVRQALEQRTVTCESYEAQLQRVQEQMLEELDEKDQELSRLREECSKAKAGVARERKAKEELRRKMEDACKQFKAQVDQLKLKASLHVCLFIRLRSSRLGCRVSRLD